MQELRVLVIGGGIGGLTAAVALRKKGFDVDIIERDPDWTVYGVGIIQQFNVIRAMASLGLLVSYLDEACGFDRTAMYSPTGDRIAEFESPRLAGPEIPANAGIRRTSLQRVLSESAKQLGASIRLGITAERIEDDGNQVTVEFSDGASGTYDVVIGADGVFSRTRSQILPDAPKPRYTGQWVWRYNFPQPDSFEEIQIFLGPKSSGLVPIGQGLMYLFILSEEAPDFKLAETGAAEIMRDRIKGAPPQVEELAKQITDDAGVVGRPLEVVFVEGDWHKGRVALIGDAVHASTPHLAQGAGMAIEDAVVLAEELADKASPAEAFTAFQHRRFERCKFIAMNSIAIGDDQMGKGPKVDVPALNAQTMKLVAQPI